MAKGPKPRPLLERLWEKATEDDVRAIRTSTDPPRLLAARYGISVSNIYAIRSRASWRDVD